MASKKKKTEPVKSLDALPPLTPFPAEGQSLPQETGTAPTDDQQSERSAPPAEDPAPQSDELPGIEGHGVSQTKLADVESLIRRYQKKKEARCLASPDELAAKKELFAALEAHHDELTVNGDGNRCYRYDGRLYVITHKLVISDADADDGGED